MSETVSVRELRNHGDRVLARVQAGETFIVTSHGMPVAELRPVAPPYLTTAQLFERRRGQEPVDAAQWIADIDEIFDQSI